MTDNIIQLDTVRIERNRPRKCTCDEYSKKFSVDTRNREITCGCGQVVDPYEAMEYLARHYDRLNEDHKRLNEQRQQWKKEKPFGVLFKDLEQHYQRGKMMPTCPACRTAFDFKHITGWSNKMFFRPTYLERPQV